MINILKFMLDEFYYKKNKLKKFNIYILNLMLIKP